MVEKLEAASQRALGLPDDAFEQRRPLQGQITKREVRAVSLYSLGLKLDSVVWDIGAGTGSISVEASIIAREGAVYAVERDEESLPLLKKKTWSVGDHRTFKSSPEKRRTRWRTWLTRMPYSWAAAEGT